jgi:hypothetical protein
VKRFLSTKVVFVFFTLIVVAALSRSANAAASIVIQNNDGANTGFNDPTAVTPVGNNSGTTLGQQRLNAFQFAANIWGATLNSNVTITIRASWAALSCSSTTATIGQAGAVGVFRDFPNAPVAGTWYPAALANALSGTDLNPSQPEISAQFNSNLGNAGCLDGIHFYLGVDNNHGNDVDLVATLIHEFAHGLGFQTFTNSSTGALNGGFPSVYDRFLLDNSTGKTWVQMTNAERQASAINVGNLVWAGAQTRSDVGSTLGTPRLRVNSPGAIAANYTVGAAGFGARLSSPGLTANVVRAAPADGCSAITNGGSVAGSIALIDRGTCAFVAKVKNAQNAGAVGVIVANNVAGVIQMGGSDSTITIPSLMISQADGTTVKGQLTSGVNATLLLDVSAPAGTDGQGHALMYAPSPIESGSSVSHWDTSLFPNQLMEPDDTGDLTHSVTAPQDLTASLLRDIGWSTVTTTPPPPPTNPIDTSDFFVRQQYLDFLNRTADTSGLNFWVNEINSCGADQTCIAAKRVNVSAAFYLSIEFQETGYLVERMYKSAYGDAPGTSTFNGTHSLAVPVVRFSEFLPDTQTIGQGVQVGVGNWQAQLEANKVSFAAAFVRRTRFSDAYATTLTPAQFVDALFAKSGVTPSATEHNTAIAEFGTANNTSDLAARGRALRDVAENSTLSINESNKAFVLMQFFGYLRRNPNDTPDKDYTGYDFWLTKLNQFNGNFQNADMVQAFITSVEYRQRFGS